MEEESLGNDKLLQDSNQIIRLIDCLLSDILKETKNLPKGNSKFHCKDTPTISIKNYLARISKYAHCSNSVYIGMLIYIDRIQERIEGFIINQFCVHRLIICSLMIAAKYLDDFYYKNDYYAKVGGISPAQMNALEIDFLKSIDFSVHIDQVQFKTYIQKICGYRQMNPQ